MNPREVIRLAREAGMEPSSGLVTYLERFFDMARAYEKDRICTMMYEMEPFYSSMFIKAIRGGEHERKARWTCQEGLQGCEKYLGGLCDCAAAIRARGNDGKE